MDTNETILSIIKEKGPILPVHVSKRINDNILMTSARLSELLTANKIRISSLKVGGSPLYYFPGQENKLQNFTDNLNGMEKKAYDLLLANNVLKDSEQEPAIRVALRQIKDFATPLKVNYENKIEIFWKWYLTDNKVVESLIKINLSNNKIPVEIPPKKELKENLVKKQIEETIKKETQEEIKNDTIKKPIKIIDKNLFLKNINIFFDKNKINILETNEVKKNQEIDFVLELQTQLGNVKYYCKTKNKKKINDSDLSTALLTAQSKGLPLLFITTGKISKKSHEKFATDYKNIMYKEI